VKAPTLLVDGRTPKFKEGDRVFGSAQGAYATMIACSEDKIRPIPKGWGFFEAAGLFVTAPTSYAALVVRAHVKKGECVPKAGLHLRGLDGLCMANTHKGIGFSCMRRLGELASLLCKSRRRSVLR
jgi:D-arabinose 1-dehydrogenase-like Zn-dependent alcohol dehydrogenase